MPFFQDELDPGAGGAVNTFGVQTALDVFKGNTPESLITTDTISETTAKAARLFIKNGNLAEMVSRLKVSSSYTDFEALLKYILESGYIGFILTRYVEDMEEVMSVQQFQGDSFTAYFRGQKARVFSYECILLETDLCPWKTVFQQLYENYLRGSKAIENNIKVVLKYGTSVVEGALFRASFSQDANTNMIASCSFNMLVSDFYLEKNIGVGPVNTEGNDFEVIPEVTVTGSGVSEGEGKIQDLPAAPNWTPTEEDFLNAG